MSAANQQLPDELQQILKIRSSRKREQKLEAYLDQHPDEIHVLWYLAELEISNKHYRKASKHLKLLTEEAPALEEGHLLYARLMSDHYTEYRTAREHFERALKMNPENTEALVDLAHLLAYRMEEYEEAQNLYERAVASSPADHSILRSLASLQYKYLEDYKAARDNLKRAVSLKPDDAFYHYFLAIIYSEQLKNFQQATFHYMKAIELNPNLSEARGHLRKMELIRERTFISEIQIEKIGHLQDMRIAVSEEEPRQLMLTGKNGSGKTRLLLSCRDYLKRILEMPADVLFSEEGLQEFQNPSDFPLKFQVRNSLMDLRFKYETGNFIVAYFPARRDLNLKPEQELRSVNLPEVTGLDDQVSDRLIAFLWNLKAQALLALEQKDRQRHRQLTDLINSFIDKIKLLDDRIRDLNFVSGSGYDIEVVPVEPFERFTFGQLADGYASVFSIIAELILRMQNKVQNRFDLEGVVLIDEPEAHLHIEMQKRVMPILTDFFPNVQFIVATHSPFILNSLSDAVIYDLAHNIRLEDASAYAYDGLVETYFRADKYSAVIKERLKHYRYLAAKKERSPQEESRLLQLEHYFENIPAYVSQELVAEYQRIKLQNMSAEYDSH